jgi:hypothetical protein
MEELNYIEILVSSKEQYKTVCEVLESHGFKPDVDTFWTDWDCFREQMKKPTHVQNHLADGFGLRCHQADKEPISFTDFIAKYGNPQPDPTDLEQRLTDLECKVGELTNLLNEIRERL